MAHAVTRPRFPRTLRAGRAGDVVVIAGNNRRKTEYLARAVAGRLAHARRQADGDRRGGIRALREAFALAAKQGVLLYDIMTERHEITTMLQKAFARIPPVFGELAARHRADPAVTKESVHHFSKLVSGAPIKRPAWFFDVAQQGEGLVDITTHLVDLVQWECFPGPDPRFRARHPDSSARGAGRRCIRRRSSRRSRSCRGIPEFLRKDVQPDGNLHVVRQRRDRLSLKGVHAKVSVLWNFEAPAGAGDTHYSVMRGTSANLVIRQGADEGWQPALYIEPVAGPARDGRALRGAAPTCARRIPASTRSATAEMAGRGAGGVSRRPRGAFRAGRRRSSSATSSGARCRTGRFPTCSPSTARRRGRSRSLAARTHPGPSRASGSADVAAEIRPDPQAIASTHEVFNQTPPLVDFNAFDCDTALREGVVRPGPGRFRN